MIKSFKHKGLNLLFTKNNISKINPQHLTKVIMVLDMLDRALELEQLNQAGFGFHSLQGKPKRYSLKVSGNWRITFEWKNGDVYRVDLEDYH